MMIHHGRVLLSPDLKLSPSVLWEIAEGLLISVGLVNSKSSFSLLGDDCLLLYKNTSTEYNST
jgi:hypothetical protein